jgi:hypothetical protein
VPCLPMSEAPETIFIRWDNFGGLISYDTKEVPHGVEYRIASVAEAREEGTRRLAVIATEDLKQELSVAEARLERQMAATDEFARRAHSAEARIAELERLESALAQLLRDNGCDCDCEHGWTEHDDDCERCFACRVQMALTPPSTPSAAAPAK